MPLNGVSQTKALVVKPVNENGGKKTIGCFEAKIINHL